MNSFGLVLPPLSVLYGAAIRARLAAYSNGLLSSTRLPVPVISVGNLTVGGTGKTPLVEKICRLLACEGRRPCVLTRGYKRKQPNARVLVSDGTRLQAQEAESGDEAFMLAQNLLGIAAVVSNANRIAAGKWAIEQLGCDTFVLDDGFQHLQLHRDLNVLVIDASNPWGGRTLLPSGRLREPVSGIKRADCVVITRTEAIQDVDALRQEIEQKTQGRPIFTSHVRALSMKELKSEHEARIEFAEPVGAFCGVGNPDSFFRLLKQAGYTLVSTKAFADHHRYSQQDIDMVVAEARQARARRLITTAKDAVKLQELRFDLPCLVQNVEISIDQEERFLNLLRKAI